MKASVTIESVFTEEPAPVVLAELEVRLLQADEPERAAQLLEQEHYLGANPEGCIAAERAL